MGERIEFACESGTLPTYVANPVDSPRGAVVVLHEWWGLAPNVEDVADRLAADGWLALAPDLYRGITANAREDARQLAIRMEFADVVRDLRCAADAARRRARGMRLGVVGFGMGASIAMHLAALDADIAATVVYYGPPPPAESGWRADAVHGAVLGHFSDHESFSPARLGRDLFHAHVPVEFHVYPGTHDGFFNDARPTSYDAAAAAESWERTLRFLSEHLAS